MVATRMAIARPACGGPDAARRHGAFYVSGRSMGNAAFQAPRARRCHCSDSDSQILLDAWIESPPSARASLVADCRPTCQHARASATHYTHQLLAFPAPCRIDAPPPSRPDAATIAAHCDVALHPALSQRSARPWPTATTAASSTGQSPGSQACGSIAWRHSPRSTRSQ
jgi:hypothetical protein